MRRLHSDGKFRATVELARMNPKCLKAFKALKSEDFLENWIFQPLFFDIESLEQASVVCIARISLFSFGYCCSAAEAERVRSSRRALALA